MTPTDLLAKLEEAECGSRELDADIAEHFGWECHGLPPWGAGWFGPNGEEQKKPPQFSTSVDAALSLVPEGWGWTLYSDASGEIYRDVPPGMLPGAPGSTVIGFEAATLPLDLCIASLRARALMGGT